MNMKRPEEIVIQGSAVSDGIAIGTPFFLNPVEEEVPVFPIALKEVDDEIARYRSALFSSRQDLQNLHRNLLAERSL